MNKKIVFGAAALLTLGFLPFGGATPIDDARDALLDRYESMLCQEDPLTHEVTHTVESIPEPSNPLLTLTMHAVCFGDLVPLDTDCTATSYSLTGWKWTTPYNGQVDPTNSYGIPSSTVVSLFNSGSEAWDGAVAADIFGSISAGGQSKNIRRQDFVNQHGWKGLGGGGTIAVTYTWAYSDGRAAESDAAYNTFYSWSAQTSGVAGKMDLLNIQTHEIGHTFGMGHSTSASVNSCLTMYPSGNYAETQKRTLGDGDLLGIEALY